MPFAKRKLAFGNGLLLANYAGICVLYDNDVRINKTSIQTLPDVDVVAIYDLK